MIFVDDSNVWIEAQKFAASGNSHMPKLQDADHDPRLRIDIGWLVERLRKNRIQGPSFLYGSRPPPNDSVWEAWKKYKFETNIYDRDNKGKEKEVDNSMSTDMSEKATELRVMAELGDRSAREKRDNTTFVVITGDRDMLPAVKKILLRCGIRVELWAWKAGISNEYLKLQAENGGQFSVRLLDSIFKDISFTAFRSTRRVKNVVGGKTIVLCDINEGEENAVCDVLLATRQLFWTTRFDGKADLCIEFPRVNQIEEVILQARRLLPDITTLSWPEYRARFNKGLRDGETLRSSNIYELLEEPQTAVTRAKETDEFPLGAGGPGRKAGNPASTSEGRQDARVLTELQNMTLNKGETGENANANNNDNSNNGDGEGWETVVGKNDPGKRHRRAVNQKQSCPSGLNCKKREDCGYRHTAQEQRIFRQNPDPQRSNLGMSKTKMCHFVPYCTRGRDCLFAHSEAEARCLDCRQTGHFQGDVNKCPLQM